MNYVAHLLLTYPHAEISIGNLIADMISNKELSSLSEPTYNGVQIHRAIDHHADSHLSMREVVGLLRPRHRKYAPVAADILLDYVLVRNWSDHCSTDFAGFEEWVYDTITTNIEAVPSQLQSRLGSMVSHRWISQYSDLKGMQHVLDRMDRRARFPSDFGEAIHDIQEHYPAMKRVLGVLMEDLSIVVKEMQ